MLKNRYSQDIEKIKMDLIKINDELNQLIYQESRNDFNDVNLLSHIREKNINTILYIEELKFKGLI